MYRSVIKGCGSYLPANIVTNFDLEEKLETSNEWIVQRTGIQQRHIAAEGEFTSDLATKAALKALKNAGMKAEEIDLIICATTTPDRTFPATAVQIQANLGLKQGFAFDMQAVCSGFVYALTTADSFLKSGQAKTALVIGAETMSRILDWSDRATCVLFGDGAGAVILQWEESSEERGVIKSCLHSDGSFQDILFVDSGASMGETVGKVKMVGREVYRHAVTKLAEVIEETLEGTGYTSKDIDLFVPHQANIRIIESLRHHAGLAEEKVMLTVAHHANTSAASIPLALAQAVEEGRLKAGDLVLLDALGGGLTWGASLLKW